jgi:rRNA maturation endonuclease Nob1
MRFVDKMKEATSSFANDVRRAAKREQQEYFAIILEKVLWEGYIAGAPSVRVERCRSMNEVITQLKAALISELDECVRTDRPMPPQMTKLDAKEELDAIEKSAAEKSRHVAYVYLWSGSSAIGTNKKAIPAPSPHAKAEAAVSDPVPLGTVCPGCGWRPPENNTQKFCGDCGSRLEDIVPASLETDCPSDLSENGQRISDPVPPEVVCLGCGWKRPPDGSQRFCNDCGFRLEE